MAHFAEQGVSLVLREAHRLVLTFLDEDRPGASPIFRRNTIKLVVLTRLPLKTGSDSFLLIFFVVAPLEKVDEIKQGLVLLLFNFHGLPFLFF